MVATINAGTAARWQTEATPYRASYSRLTDKRARRRIRVLIADDHTLLRQGLRFLLETKGNVEVVAEARNGREAIIKTEEFRPDIVLMDIAMPVMNGIEATRQIARRDRRARVVILSTRMYEDYLSQILQAGAAGYVLKDADADELLRAIEEVHYGNSYLSPALSRTIVFDYLNGGRVKRELEDSDNLTCREREILQLIAEGYSNQQIAEQLCVSVKTVEAHKAHMIAKLSLKGSAALTRYAIQRELMQAEA